MFVVNFDFSDLPLFKKLVFINFPVVITELLTYPLQRIQTQLILRDNYITNSSWREMNYLMRMMNSQEGFPKIWFGARYSIDYTVTQMTCKFLLFDYLNSKFYQKSSSKAWVYGMCIIANAFSTIMSQSSYNYQTIASSIEPDKNNRSENLILKLKDLTVKKFLPFSGLKYTMPISVLNSCLELFVISSFKEYFVKKSISLEENYGVQQGLAAISMLFLTSFTIHFALQRQIQICLNLRPYSIPYKRGLLGSLIRNMTKGLILYGIYFWHCQIQAKADFQGQFLKRDNTNRLPQYYNTR